MRIGELQIENYKCFRSLEVRLSHGFNVIVGQNNAGKTAFVEALSLRFGDNPHRSLKTLPNRGALPNQVSRVNISFEVDANELIELFKRSLPTFHVPIPPSWNPQAADQAFLDAISTENTFECSFQSGSVISPRLSRYDHGMSSQALEYQVKADDSHPRMTGVYSGNYQPFAFHVANILRDRIYLFKAERFNVAESNIGVNTNLLPDASNLPEVLLFLQSSNPSRFKRLKDYVMAILPEIKDITVPPISINRARILVWSIDSQTERDDLAIPLSESGTGISQVLAMLYVVVTSDYPRTIIIDEPQSFLHPGAIRKLFEILKQHPQHQYIVTTHSPTAVTAAEPQSLLLLRKNELESAAEEIDVKENQKLRFFLLEVGAKLSDVFGADNILWVEGSTEEQCFPLIISRILKQPLSGTAIVGVMHTGDFESKHSRMIIEIYNRLSQGKGLLPPAIGFIFDREERSQKEQEDLISRSKGAVRFTKRRMYENYLLNPNALASVMSNIEGFRDREITPKEIQEWLVRNCWNRKYFERAIAPKEQSEELWQKDVNGAKVLEDIFKELSENRINFDKIEYGVALTKWIIDNSPEDLREIADLLALALEKK